MTAFRKNRAMRVFFWLRWLYFLPALIPLLVVPLVQCQKTKQTGESKIAAVPAPQADLAGKNNDADQEPAATGATLDSAGYGAVCDSIKSALGAIPSLDTICAISGRIIQLRAGPKEGLADSVVNARIKNGFENILAYKRVLAFGLPLPGAVPPLVRDTMITDTLSLKVLPKVGISSYLVDGHFFFLGGGPFLARQSQESGELFTDPQGKPERRFSCSINANTERMLNAVRHLRNVRINVQFGPPLIMYEGLVREINGIGSLIHVFTDRIPAYFLTEAGIVPASLVSVTQKLLSQDLCVSNSPEVVFACRTIPSKEILGVYIPLESEKPATCVVSRTKHLWTADLNSDSVPEFAGVLNTFAGIASDTLQRIIWYVNIQGKWKIIDQAEEFDCT